ncbi:MAG: DUF1996 domain-containing protein [Actinomycetota bacterium]
MPVVLVILAGWPVTSWAQPSPGWVEDCGYSHSEADDPIGDPGSPGASALNDFFGNTTTRSSSTIASMAAGSTSCASSADTAAVWAPALFRDGKRILPAGAPPDGTSADFHARTQILYETDLSGLPPSAIRPIPAGLRMVAGNADAENAKQNPQLGGGIYWGCSDNQPSGKFSVPVDCATGIISLHVGFADCWDGVHLDSADHESHMAFPVSSARGYVCPKDHPVPLPRVILRVEYPTGTNASGITLSSGPAFTAHASYWNTWDQTALASLTRACLGGSHACGENPNPGSPLEPSLSHRWPARAAAIVVIVLALLAAILIIRRQAAVAVNGSERSRPVHP